MKAFLVWLDRRTGYQGFLHGLLYESVPGGARWRYVWGSTLVFTFAVQVITGVFLWMAYSPSAQTAWESVYFIQYRMHGGWLLRGIHHYTAQVMVVLLGLHLMQVVIDGAYKAPREVNFWLGLLMLMLVLVLSLTGYLLPWDEKGYWATRVATNLVGIIPWVGGALQRLIVGGPNYGHHTLTRFFALHAGVVPATLVLLLVGHLYLFRRHGLTARNPGRRPAEAFWPDQALRDAVACLAVLGVVLFLVVYRGLAHAGAPLGAELGAPADPSEPYSAARPEWYFLFLFQLLKYFPGRTELIGAIGLPLLVWMVLFGMPLVGRSRLGHRFNVAFLFALWLGAGGLTYLAVAQNRRDPAYQAAVRQAAAAARRVVILAESPGGIPAAGAVTLLRADPLTRGPRLFAEHCASCHRYGGLNGMGGRVKEAEAASDLRGFASRAWLRGLLDPQQIGSIRYFGGTKFKDGKMARFVHRDVARYTIRERAALRKVIVALSAEAGLKAQGPADRRDVALIAEGRSLFAAGAPRCTDCHQFRKPDETATAPDLTGYGSREWLVGMISNPKDPRFYGRRSDRMPAFGAEHILDKQSIGLLADWLRGEWYEPGGAAAPGPLTK